MPIIDTPAGTLEVTNAILSASEFRATQKISVSNSAPTKNFSVGDKFHVSTTDADAVNITGNLVAQTLKIGNLLVSPTFDLAAVSNVGNTTSNTLQFANATTSFVASSNVEIGGNITLTSNAQVKVGSNVLAEYTGPHGREPKEMPLKKFPEIAFDESKFDRNDSTNTYTQAGYTVSGSAPPIQTGRQVWQVFDQKGFGDHTPSHETVDNRYNSGTGAHTGGVSTTVSGTSYLGDWIQVKLPKKIRVKHVNFGTQTTYGYDRVPISGIIAGSTNGSDWTLVKNFTKTSSDFIMGEFTQIDVNNAEYYDYYRFIAVTLVGGDTRYACQELEYYGYEEPAPPGDLSLDTTLKSTFNSVRSNNYVMYFDGKDPDTGNVPKYLPSGSVKSITPHNVVFDATNNCWTLDGSTESNVTTGSLGFEGDVPHTVSTWINASNLEANALTQQLFSIGSGYDKSFLKVDDTQIAANTWHNVTYAYQGEGGSKVTYVDGRKVEEAQVEDTFGEYPPFAMTDYKTGGYCVSASSDDYNANGFYAYKAFNDVQGDEGWHGGVGNGTTLHFTANAGGSVYDASISGGTSSPLSGNVGEWIKLEMPHKLVVGYVNVKSRGTSTPSTQSPKDFKILGSNDDINWDILESFTSVPYAITGQNHAVGATKGYKYIAFLVTRIQRTDTAAVVIGELKFYGHKEGDLTRFPEPTRALKYPHIAMTGLAQRGYVASSSNENGDYPAWEAFDGSTGVSIASGDAYCRWQPGSTSPGRYIDPGSGPWTPSTSHTDNTTTLASGSSPASYTGDWIQLESPNKVNVKSYRVYNSTDYVTTYNAHTVVLLGSNTGNNDWVDIGSGEEVLSWSPNTETSSNHLSTVASASTSGNTGFYKYHRLIVRKVTDQHIPVVFQVQFYGTEEDTGTPAIVGGPFAGKVANFRVYDQYLGDERIQEIYDAQKDAFGHKKSSMTLYKGRVGVGTTEPEGALTVVDEPHALAKFPARAVSADDSYVEGDGHIKLSSAESSTTGTQPPVSVRSDGPWYEYPGYVYSGDYRSPSGFVFNAFDGLTSTCWYSAPTRNTRVSEEVDFGAWLKIQTPESMSLKKAEIESKPDWRQVGSMINDNAEYAAAGSSFFGMDVDCSDDGTRVIIGAFNADEGGTDRGQAFVFDWNGYDWVQLGNTLQGTQNGEKLGYAVAISGDGNYIAIGNPYYHTPSSITDAGRYGVFYLNGATWTILPDAGALTSTTVNEIDYFVGTATSELAGFSLSLSYDGKTISAGYRGSVSGAGGDAGQIRVHTYVNGAWTQKGQALSGLESADRLGDNIDMSSDGNHLIAGSHYGAKSEVYVYDYVSGSTSWVKRTTLTHPTLPNANTHFYGSSVAISDDGNTVAVGASSDDVDGTDFGRAYVYTWSGSAWTLVGTLSNPQPTASPSDIFGSTVSLSGDGTRLIVAASREDNGFTDNGQVYTYEYYGGSWQLRQPMASIGAVGLGDGTRLGEYPDGCMISRDGSTIVVGDYAGVSKVRVFNMPSNIKSIWGSNDDTNWTKITTGNETFRGNDRLEFKNLDNPNYYKYHAIIADAFTQLKDVKLFGVRNQGSSTLHDGTLTLTKNLDVPRIGPPPDADDTPRRDRLVVEYNTHNNPLGDGVVRDTSGRGNDGVFYGGTSYSADGKALEFDGTGSNDYIRSRINPSITGEFIHSFSIWLNFTALEGSYDYPIFIGSIGALNQTSILRTTNGVIGPSFGSGYNLFSNFVPNTNQWYHMVVVYRGGAVNVTNVDYYIDGVKRVISNDSGSEGTGTLAIDENTLSLGDNPGGGNPFKGRISNFKLYNTALTVQEVKTIYQNGRCSNAIPKTLHIMGGMMRYNNDIGKLQIHNGARWSTIGGIRASGGRRSTFGDYALHVFTESGTFSIDNNEGGYVDILIVAGGGSGGGASNGGGGGAGGILFAQNYFLSGGAYTATVGAGAAATNASGGNGGDSSFSRINATAKGGGAGGDYRVNGGAGGNGGGAGADDRNVTRSGGGTNGSTPSGFTKYGNSGGGGTGGTSGGRAGGGGGGAGGAGTWANSNLAGSGGLGIDLSATFGTNVGESGYFASGGGGQSRSSVVATWPGPLGGGGANNGNRAGLPNTGGGSHAGYDGLLINPGGSGVIIVRYLV